MIYVKASEIERVSKIEDREEMKSEIKRLLFIEGTKRAADLGAKYPKAFLRDLSNDLFDAALSALKQYEIPECIPTAIDIAFCLDRDLVQSNDAQADAVTDYVADGITALYDTAALIGYQKRV